MSNAQALAQPRPRLRGPMSEWSSWLAWTVFILMVGAIVAAPLVAPRDPNEQDLIRLLEGPSLEFPMGTDLLGRDLLSRVIWGGGPPLLVGMLAVLLALAIGVTAGVLAGYREGFLDGLISRVADIQMSIPGLALALLVLVMLGSSVTNLVLVIAIESWPLHFRVVRSHVQTVRRHGYIEAAGLAGLTRWQIIRRHVVPSALPILAVTATVNFSHAVLAEAGLSFLGIGIQPPRADWGVMVAEGQSQLGDAWWISVFPGLALLAMLWSVQMIGDHLAARFSVNRS